MPRSKIGTALSETLAYKLDDCSNCLSSMMAIREVLVALSTQLISNADKVTSADC